MEFKTKIVKYCGSSTLLFRQICILQVKSWQLWAIKQTQPALWKSGWVFSSSILVHLLCPSWYVIAFHSTLNNVTFNSCCVVVFLCLFLSTRRKLYVYPTGIYTLLCVFISEGLAKDVPVTLGMEDGEVCGSSLFLSICSTVWNCIPRWLCLLHKKGFFAINSPTEPEELSSWPFPEFYMTSQVSWVQTIECLEDRKKGLEFDTL